MKYLFNNVIFAPDDENKLVVNGTTQSLSIRLAALLRYFLDNNEQVRSNQEILDAVWGDGEHRFEAVRAAVSRLNRLLPQEAQIRNLRLQGYLMSVDLKKVETKYRKTELILEESPFVKKAAIIAMASLFFLSIAALGSWAGVGHWIDHTPNYTVQNLKPVFTRDHLVGIPQLSPDGRYVAYRQTRDTFDNANLAVTDLQSGETQSFAKMMFTDGIKWSPNGNKIVYQYRDAETCQIRLLEFDNDKNLKDNTILTECLPKSGVLTFAWFNEHEFYVNLVDSHTEGFSIHQLYSFDIRTKALTKLLTAENKGVGFFSLEYDASIDSLYLLMTSNFVESEFYRYRAGKLSKLKTIEYPVWYYAAANNQLIYKDNRNNLLINQPADNFDNPKILLPSTMEPIMKPHINGSKLTFLAGSTYGFELKKRLSGQLTTVSLEGFEPSVLARYKGSLIFASGQTGIYQIYLLSQDNRVIKISDISQNEYIHHIEVAEAADMFAVSYQNKVDIYKYEQGELMLMHSLPGYRDAFISADGETILVSQLENSNSTGNIIELRTHDLQPTGLEISNAKMAVYYQGQVVYVDDKQQLIRFDESAPNLLATDIHVQSLMYTDLHSDKLYYIAIQDNRSTLFAFDFTDRSLNQIRVNGSDPTKVEVIQDEIFIRTRQLLRPKIMIGEMATN